MSPCKTNRPPSCVPPTFSWCRPARMLRLNLGLLFAFALVGGVVEGVVLLEVAPASDIEMHEVASHTLAPFFRAHKF